MPLERDSLLYNRYRILETLGQGGMGAVYRAMDENLGVEVAVKENLFSSDESTRQFRREATILASMRHNNLPRVSDHFEIADQGQYLVMDYIEGEDLHQRMNRVDTLPEEEVIVIGAAICDALSYMHNLEPPILHRDIKPGNIKIDPAGGVYLVDFGLAKIMQGSQTTTTGARAMTPGYSSPEQYGMARTDVRSDIYSLGATLYAAVTGTIPEDGLARAMEQADLTPARKRNSKVSRRIAQVIDTSLEIHPDDRYQTAEAFKQAMLEASSATRMRAEAGELTIQPPPPEVVAAIAEGKAPKPKPVAEPEIKMSGESKTRRRRRKVAQRRTKRRTMIRRLTLLAIVGIAGLYAAVVTGTIDDIFGLQLAVAPPSKAATATHTQAPATLEASATSEPLVVEASATATPQPSATSTAPQPTDTPVPLEDTPAAGTATPLLPPPTRDGAVPWVAFVSTRGGLPQIWLVDTAGNGLTQLTDLEGGACQPDWSPDAARVVFISPCDQDKTLYLDANLYTINADGSDLQPLPTPVGSFDPAWSPDGSRILYTAAADANHAEIASLTLADGSITALTANGKLNYQAAWSPDGSQIAFVSSLQAGKKIWVAASQPGAEAQLLTRSGTFESTHPVWAADGASVLYSRQESGGGVSILVSVGLDMLGVSADDYLETPLTTGPDWDADISSDGLWLVVESWPDGSNHDIYLIHIESGEQVRLTSDPGQDFEPAIAPGTP